MKSFNEEDITSPTFNNIKCEQYFQVILSEKNTDRLFERPEWMPSIPAPTTPSFTIPYPHLNRMYPASCG